MQFHDNIAHQIHIVGPAGAVVTDRAHHAVIDRFVDYTDRQHSLFTFIDIRIIQHNAIAVKTVHQNVLIPPTVIITDHRHGIAIVFDAVIQ